MANSDLHYRYWTEDDKREFEQIDSFADLAAFALTIAERMPENIHVVSGPISTGGFGTVQDNMRVFGRIVESLTTDKGLNVLSWVPYEGVIRKLLKRWRVENPDASYCMPILADFYLPMFESGRISDAHFIPGWESSFGAKWEHEQCVRLEINRHYLALEFAREMLKV